MANQRAAILIVEEWHAQVQVADDSPVLSPRTSSRHLSVEASSKKILETLNVVVQRLDLMNPPQHNVQRSINGGEDEEGMVLDSQDWVKISKKEGKVMWPLETVPRTLDEFSRRNSRIPRLEFFE